MKNTQRALYLMLIILENTEGHENDIQVYIVHIEIVKLLVLVMDGEYTGFAGAYSCYLIDDEWYSYCVR